MKNDTDLKNLCLVSALIVQDAQPQDEHTLLKELSREFTGYTIKRYGKKGAKVYAEIAEHNAKGQITKIGWVNFRVPSCRKFYKRDSRGRIYNIEYFRSTAG